jgi:hypothetical protein
MKHLRFTGAAILFPPLLLLATYWPHARNEIFLILGNRLESGGWYGFWSGFAGSIQPTLIGTAVILYWHHTCHASPRCLRLGKYAAAGGMFKLCRVHHPDLLGKHPHSSLIHELHRQHRPAAGP